MKKAIFILIILIGLRVATFAATLDVMIEDVLTYHKFNSEFNYALRSLEKYVNQNKYTIYDSLPIDYNVNLVNDRDYLSGNLTFKLFLYDDGERKALKETNILQVEQWKYSALLEGRRLIEQFLTLLLQYWHYEEIIGIYTNFSNQVNSIDVELINAKKVLLETQLYQFGVSEIPLPEEVTLPDNVKRLDEVLTNIETIPEKIPNLKYQQITNSLIERSFNNSNSVKQLYIEFNTSINNKSKPVSEVYLKFTWSIQSAFSRIISYFQYNTDQKLINISLSKPVYRNVSTQTEKIYIDIEQEKSEIIYAYKMYDIANRIFTLLVESKNKQPELSQNVDFELELIKAKYDRHNRLLHILSETGYFDDVIDKIIAKVMSN